MVFKAVNRMIITDCLHNCSIANSRVGCISKVKIKFQLLHLYPQFALIKLRISYLKIHFNLQDTLVTNIFAGNINIIDNTTFHHIIFRSKTSTNSEECLNRFN